MKMKIRTLIFALGLLCGFTAFGAEGILSKVTLMGQTYYRYEVKKGETMYGLSRQFGWDESKLQAWNPNSFSPLDKGTIVYYPCDVSIQPAESALEVSPASKDSPIDKNGFRKHKIAPGETLYGVAKEYGVSIGAIMEANPGVRPNHFQAGAEIRIPAEGTGIESVTQEVRRKAILNFKSIKVKKDDTWRSLAAKYNEPQELLMEANKGITLKKNQYIGIPVVGETVSMETVANRDVREETNEGIEDIYRQIHGIDASSNGEELRIAVLLDEPSSRKDSEYLRGFLTGIDKMKNSGVRIVMKAIDGDSNASDNLAELEAFQPDVVFATAERSLPYWLGDYAKENKVYVVNSFDVKDEQYKSNPYIIQAITPSENFNEEVAEWIRRNHDGYSLVFVGDRDPGDALAEALRQNWDPSKVRERSVSDLTALPLAENGKYLMYSYPVKKADVSEFLNAVEAAMNRQPLATVSVVGRPNWIVYEEALEPKFRKAGVMIPSRFYMDKDRGAGMQFNLAYRQMFDRQLLNSFPVYGAVGYDNATYFINSLGKNGGDVNTLPDAENLVQNTYSFSRPENWSGLLNTATFILRYTPYGGTDKIIVK